MSLVLNIFPYYVSGDFITYTPDKISFTPKLPRPQMLPQFGKFLKYLTGRHTFQYLHYLRWRISGWYLNKYMHVISQHFHCIYPELILLGYLLKLLFQIPRNFPTQYVLPVLRYPYQVILQIVYGVFCPSNPHAEVIQEKVLFRQASLPRLSRATFFPSASWRVSSRVFYKGVKPL
jgi:hypothetical protein